MPIYAYRCSDCGFQQDVLQKISDAPLTVCPSCGHESFGKQLSAPAFQLKGTGWYVTDFRDNGKKPSGSDKGATEAGGKSGGSAAAASSEAGSGTAGAADKASAPAPAPSPAPAAASGSN